MKASRMRILRLVLPLILLCTSCAAMDRNGSSERVLFVGNSLTYFGNVPAIYAALGKAEGRATRSDMIVRGGATLAERVADGSVARALSANRYSALVLQERGGDLLCGFGPDSCIASRRSIKALAGLAKQQGVPVVLLGTYQGSASTSRVLVEKESEAAVEAGIAYVDVATPLQHLRGVAPELLWFADDGMHPGKDLALLNALLVQRGLHGALPQARALRVAAPIYGNNSGLTETLRRADAAAPLPGTPIEVRYTKETLEVLRHGIGSSGT